MAQHAVTRDPPPHRDVTYWDVAIRESSEARTCELMDRSSYGMLFKFYVYITCVQ